MLKVTKFSPTKLFKDHVLDLAKRDGPDTLIIVPNKGCTLKIQARRGRDILFTMDAKVDKGGTLHIDGVSLNIEFES